MEHIQSTYELRAILQAEQDNQARERRRMHIEDVRKLSCFLPVSCCRYAVLFEDSEPSVDTLFA